MFLSRTYRDEDNNSRVGRISFTVEEVEEILDLPDTIKITSLGFDNFRARVVIILTGPGLPVHKEAALVESVSLKEVRKLCS